MPTTVIVDFTTKPGQRDALVEFLSAAQPMAIDAGCKSIAVHRVQGEANRVVEVEYWENRAAHEAFVKGAMDSGAFAPFDDMLDGPLEVAYLDAARTTEA